MRFQEKIGRWLLGDYLEKTLDRKIKERRIRPLRPLNPSRRGEVLSPLKTVPDATFTIFEKEEPLTFWGYLDTSSLGHGDEIEVSVFMKVDSQGSFKRYRTQTITGPVSDPLVVFPERQAEAVKITVKQLTGQPRELLSKFMWK